MSDTTQNTQNQNPTTSGQGTGNDGKNINNQQPPKVNIFVRGFRKAKEVVGEAWKEIKSHPVTHGLMALGGTVGGGYLVYKVMDAQRPIVPETPAVPQLAEPVKEEDEQQTENRVEYVDIPKDDEPVTEEQ